MKTSKLLNLLLILTPLAGYLEWGQGNASFLFEAELQVLGNLATNPTAAIHPFTIMPMLGQLILIFTLFQKQPGKKLTFAGIGCIAILLLFMLFIGISSVNYKIVLSTVPFLATSIVTILYYYKIRKQIA